MRSVGYGSRRNRSLRKGMLLAYRSLRKQTFKLSPYFPISLSPHKPQLANSMLTSLSAGSSIVELERLREQGGWPS